MPTFTDQLAALAIDRRERGALSAIRGLRYQWLYSLRLMAAILDGVIDEYRQESIDDFVAWKADERTKTGARLKVIQVKHSLSNPCVIRASGRSVLTSFARICEARLARLDVRDVEVTFVLAYNAGHDCAAQGCKAYFEGLEEHSDLRRHLSALGVAPTSRIVPDRFVDWPPKREQLLAEVAPLLRSEPSLARYFEAPAPLSLLVRNIVGMSAPFQAGRRRIQDLETLDFSSEPPSRRAVRDELLSSIAAVAAQLERASSISRQNARLMVERQRVESDIAVAHRVQIAANDSRHRLAQFETRQDAIEGLLKVWAIEEEPRFAFWRSKKITFVSESDGLVIAQAIDDDLVPLPEFLARNPRHRERIQLILSLVAMLQEWSLRGLFLADFRAESVAAGGLYFVRSTSPPSLVIGDLDAVGLDSPDAEGLLTAEWIRGPALAKAIRYIYYGRQDDADAVATPLHRAPWNDNVVRELANWVDGGLLRITTLMGDLAELFESERTGYPLVVHNLHPKFVHDCVDAELTPVVRAFMNFFPERLRHDRAFGQRSAYFALADKKQIGFVARSSEILTATTLNLYDKQRWRSARAKDWSMSTALSPDGTCSAPILVNDPAIAREAILQLFGLDYDSYLVGFEKRRDEAHLIDTRRQLEPILQREDDWQRRLHRRLARLSGKEFRFQLAAADSTPERFFLKIAEGEALKAHLDWAGFRYNPLELGVRGIDLEELRFTATAHAVSYRGPSALLEVSSDWNDDRLPEGGAVCFVDRGASLVVNTDSVPLSALKSTAHDPGAESGPPQEAWAFLRGLTGDEELGPRTTRGLWHEEAIFDLGRRTATYVGARLEETCIRIVDELSGLGRVCLVTGAAGTGKTKLVASVAQRFLGVQPLPGTLTARRILVVAASHYALDNFARTFRDSSEGQHIPYRFIGQGHIRKRERGDAGIRTWSRDYYRHVVETLMSRLQPTGDGRPLASISADLLQRLEELERLSDDEADPMLVVPSHESWRSRVLSKVRLFGAAEKRVSSGLLKRRLENLANAGREPDPKALRALASPELDPYACFAARIVIATVDACVQLPDTKFDLLICEEASQLRLVKLLKVLTKVIRARGDGSLPALILSGDARQLPPFVETFDNDDDEQDEQNAAERSDARQLQLAILNAQSPFEAMCLKNPSLVTTMSRQHRMAPAIAELIRFLFYSDQDWDIVRTGHPGHITWIDTSDHPDARARRQGPSKLNPGELRVVKSLCSCLAGRSEDILVVTPYAAQASSLRLDLPETIDVQTIDGCQGREAETVVVSFVSLDFYDGRSFVGEPRRVNVALSRARSALYLVGSLAELRNSVAATGEQYRHMAGLLALFGPGGRLSDCVRQP